MNKKRYGVNIGTSSILIIFVIVSLVSFAALSIVSANSDYKLTRKMAERETAYYEACNLANEDMRLIDELFTEYYIKAEGDVAFYDLCAQMEGFNPIEKTLTNEYPISDIQSLQVVLQIHGDEAMKSYDVLSFRVITTGELEYNEKLPVLP